MPGDTSSMDRRTFIAAMSAAAVAPGLARADSQDLGYVDSHSHLWSPERGLYPLRAGAQEEKVSPKGFTAGEFFSHARREGVTRMVVVGHTGHFGYDERYLVDVARARPGEIAIQAFLDHADEGVVARMGHLKDQGVKAFRLRLLDPFQVAFPDSHPIFKAYESPSITSPASVSTDSARRRRCRGRSRRRTSPTWSGWPTIP